MDWDHIARNWQQFNQRVRAKWEKLTDDNLVMINGRRNRLEVKIRQRYGFSSDHIRKEVDDWVRWQQSIASAQRVPGFFLDQQNQIATKTARRYHSRKLAQVLGFGSLALLLWRAIIAALWTQVSAHSVCFGLERPVAASVFDVVGAYVTVP